MGKWGKIGSRLTFITVLISLPQLNFFIFSNKNEPDANATYLASKVNMEKKYLDVKYVVLTNLII